MASRTALRRTAIASAFLLALGVGISAAAVRAEEPLPTDEELLKSKCSLCHEGHRIYRLKPDQIRPVLERMRKMNPDWITTADSDHIAKVIAKILDDPNIIAEREAWVDSVSRGETLFEDPGLGKNGKSCASCHAPASFRNATDLFPKFDPTLKRFVDIQEWINLMITQKMAGTALPPNDQRYLDLVLYIKSLK